MRSIKVLSQEQGWIAAGLPTLTGVASSHVSSIQRKRVGSMRLLETQTAFTVFASGRASGLSDPIRHTVPVRRL